MGARKHFKKTFGLISSSRTLSGDPGILPRVECTCGVAQLSRMRVGTQSTWIFRPLGLFDRRHAQNIWSNSDQSYFVRCQDLGIRDLTPVSHKCTVSGLESIRAFPSECNEALTHGAARCTHAGMNWSTSAACTDTESSHGIM